MDRMTFADQVNHFNASLELNSDLPEGIEVMNPFENRTTFELSSAFYNKYYKDHQSRKLILGINPGRLGAGLTGIPFTDPVKLQEICGIKNELNKATEPSAGFIYDMITAYGGPKLFYDHYFINSVSPLGFVKNGVNYNYYDSKELEKAITPFILESLNTLLNFQIDTTTCYCLGNGKNYKFLDALNKKHQFFIRVIPLPHPRWIVQYRRKRYDEYIQEYLKLMQ